MNLTVIRHISLTRLVCRRCKSAVQFKQGKKNDGCFFRPHFSFSATPSLLLPKSLEFSLKVYFASCGFFLQECRKYKMSQDFPNECRKWIFLLVYCSTRVDKMSLSHEDESFTTRQCRKQPFFTGKISCNEIGLLHISQLGKSSIADCL